MPVHTPKTQDWPPKMRIYVYDEELCLIEESEDRKYDLNDNLFQTWYTNSRTVYVGIETRSKNWPKWDEGSLKWIEDRISWDLEFDGNEVRITRITENIGHPCAEEFIWRLDIRDS